MRCLNLELVGGRRLSEIEVVAKFVFLAVLLRKQVLLAHSLLMSSDLIRLDAMYLC